MDYSDHWGDGENDDSWDIFGNRLGMGCKGKISYYDSKMFGKSKLVNVPYTEIEEWVVFGVD